MIETKSVVRFKTDFIPHQLLIGLKKWLEAHKADDITFHFE